MLLVTKASVTMPCETHVLENLKIPMAVCILAAKGTDPILCYPEFPVYATSWRLSQAGNTSSSSVFSVVEMGSLFQVYATTGLNLPRKFMNTNGCCISFHCNSESQRLNGCSNRYSVKRKMLQT